MAKFICEECGNIYKIDKRDLKDMPRKVNNKLEDLGPGFICPKCYMNI